MTLSRLGTALPAFLALFAALVSSDLATAQPMSGKEADRDTRERLVRYLGTEKFSIQQFALPGQADETIDLFLDLDGRRVTLALDHHDLRGGGYQLLSIDAEDRIEAARPSRAPTYRGQAFVPGSASLARVAASVLDRQLHALLLGPGGRIQMIEPVSEVVTGADRSLHLVYDAADTNSAMAAQLACATEALPGLRGDDHEDGGDTDEMVTPKLCQIAIEADTFYFVKKGSTVAGVESAVLTLLNAVSLIYEAEVNITYDLSALVIQAGGGDNYSSTKHDKLYNQFRNYWNAHFGNLKRDTAHLLTGRTIQGNIGGFAAIGEICNKSYCYGLSWATIPGFPPNDQIAITAHELGHNFNAQHCNGDGDCAIMCSLIGSCSGSVTIFGNRSENAIIKHRKSRSCLSNAPAPLTLPFTDLFDKLKGNKWGGQIGTSLSSKGFGETSGQKSVNLDKRDVLRSNDFALNGETNVELSFFTEHRKVENGEELIVEFLNSSFSWQELGRIASDGTTQNSFRHCSYRLPGSALHDAFRLRLRGDGDQANDDWYIDDILIRSTPPVTTPHLCGTDNPPVVVHYNPGGAAPGNRLISVMNCGDKTMGLGWTAAENPAVGWLSLNPTAGTVTSGEPQDFVSVIFNTAGLLAGIYTTNVKVTNVANAAEYVDVPVTLIVHDDTGFSPGDQLTGLINPTAETDMATFVGARGQKLTLRGSITSGNLKLKVTVLDPNGAPVANLKYKGSKAKNQTVNLKDSGLYKLVFSAQGGTTGGYSIKTSLKQPGAGKLSAKTLRPGTGGGTVPVKISGVPGTIVSVTIVPQIHGKGPFDAELRDPNSALIHTDEHGRSLPSGGYQLLTVPIGMAGNHILTISGFAGREKVIVSVDPEHPTSAGVVPIP